VSAVYINARLMETVMSDPAEGARPRSQGRSPPFPFVPLAKALERLRQFDDYSRGHPVRAAIAVQQAWKYNPKSSGGLQTLAAVKAFGLLTDAPNGDDRRIQTTDSGKRLLRNPPDAVRLELLRKAALTPRLINEYWQTWKSPRPPDSDCLWELQDQRGFTTDAAKRFLFVYDETLLYAKLAESDNVPAAGDDIEEDVGTEQSADMGLPDQPPSPPVPPDRKRGVVLMDGERIVFTEEGQPNQYLKLIASGDLDEGLLEALEDFAKRQRKRMALIARYSDPANMARRTAEIERRATQTDEEE
jgi:hypothetical protein